MAGMNIGPAFGAGAASDALRQIVMDRLYQQMAQHQMGLQDAEFAANTDYRNRALAEQTALRQSNQDVLNQNRQITQADKLSDDLEPGQSVSPGTAGILRGGLRGDLINSNPEAAGSQFVAPGGQADFAPGQQPGLAFKGTAGQLRMLRQENDRVAAQQDIERNREAQQHKPIPINTVKNGQPVQTFVDPTTIQPGDTFPQFEKPTKEPNPQPQVFYDKEGKPHALQFVNGAAKEIPLPDNIAGKSATTAERAVSKGEARTILNSLDQDIDTAANSLGPIHGRVSDAESYIGNPDPAVTRLAARMMAAKMKVDAGLGGMRAAASPQLLARWDKVMAMPLNPANLHEAVQVMREMVGGEPSGGGGGLSYADYVASRKRKP